LINQTSHPEGGLEQNDDDSYDDSTGLLHEVLSGQSYYIFLMQSSKLLKPATKGNKDSGPASLFYSLPTHVYLPSVPENKQKEHQFYSLNRKMCQKAECTCRRRHGRA
jgi:hypothetical protein